MAKIAVRNKERLCALRPLGGTLMLETLFYPDEIRVEMDTELPEIEVSDRELDMAFALIDLLSEGFEPEKYHDQYREALTEIIEAKLQGQEVVAAPAAAAVKVTDLMTALKVSVEAAKERKQKRATEAVGGRRRKASAG